MQSPETQQQFQKTLTLRCWEDPGFASRLRSDPESTLAELFPGQGSDADFEASRSLQIPPSPLPPVMNAEEGVLLAFWEEVFEPV
jgi:hypothetical protein